MTDLDIAFKINEQIVIFWQFYVAFAAGIIGWVLARSSGWHKEKRLGLTFGVIIFNIFNIAGLYKASTALSSILDVFKLETYKVPPGMSAAVFEAACKRLSHEEWYFQVAAHLVADIVLLYFVLVISAKKPPKEQ